MPETFKVMFEIRRPYRQLTMLTHPQHPRSPDMQRSSDMTPWTVKFGLSLTVAFAAISATAAKIDGRPPTGVSLK
jgi:hypothetical protein